MLELLCCIISMPKIKCCINQFQLFVSSIDANAYAKGTLWPAPSTAKHARINPLYEFFIVRASNAISGRHFSKAFFELGGHIKHLEKRFSPSSSNAVWDYGACSFRILRKG
jgi:hypothetical protein